MNGHIALVGMRASGKTTIGRLFAEKSGRLFVDTDNLIMRRAEVPISELVRNAGWDAFRRLESVILEQVLEREEKQVVSCGGGIVLLPENRELLKKHAFTIYLETDVQTMAARLKSNPNFAQRPPLTDAPSLEEEIAKTLSEREGLYKECADLILDGGKPIKKLLAELQKTAAIRL